MDEWNGERGEEILAFPRLIMDEIKKQKRLGSLPRYLQSSIPVNRDDR